MIKYFVIRTFRGTCSSVEMLKGYMLIFWIDKAVHAHLSHCEGKHGQRKVGNPWPRHLVLLIVHPDKALVHPDISKCTKISMELFYTAQLCTILFEVAHNWMRLLQLAKIWFDWWTLPNTFPLYLSIFIFTQNSMKHEGCWNYHVIPVQSREVSMLPSGAKENGKIVSDYFSVDLAVILP